MARVKLTSIEDDQERGIMKLNVTRKMADAKDAMSVDAFRQAAGGLREVRHIVREQAQQKTSSEIKTILEKLRSDSQLATEEIALVKSWFVGDAIGYTNMQPQHQDSLTKYETLEKTIAGFEDKDCTSEDLLRLHAVLEEATRTNDDIAYFLEKKERIERFELAISDGLDKDERDALVTELICQLESKKW